MMSMFFNVNEMSKISPTLKLSMDRTSTNTNASTVINQINLSRSPSSDNPYAKIEELGGETEKVETTSSEDFLNTLI